MAGPDSSKSSSESSSKSRQKTRNDSERDGPSSRAPIDPPTGVPSDAPTEPGGSGGRGTNALRRSQAVVVGIGASAGCANALRLLLAAMPANTGMAFVVVAHLDPPRDSEMASLLSEYTTMPVERARDGTPVEANRVYLIPPHHSVHIQEGRLFLENAVERRGVRMPIDRFFRSLAEDRGERAVCIVLSGTGADGALGVRDVKAAGGLTIAQKLATAEHDGMPHSAVATRMIDFFLPIEEIPGALVRYADHSYVRGFSEEPDEERSGNLHSILGILRSRADFDFRSYRSGTLHRRVHRRMGLRHIESIDDYHKLLREDDREVRDLAKDLLISATRFFRDPEAWEVLEREAVSRIVSRCAPGGPIRVWIPACATGEEAYSAAMLFQEVAERQNKSVDLQIFATDLDSDSIAIARQGIYPANIAADVPADRLRKHFREREGHYRIEKRLRKASVFAVQNLISDPPFSNLDLISCRNLLIYLEPEAQRRLIDLFHFALAPEGVLFLGSSESTGPSKGSFATISNAWRVFSKVGASTREGVSPAPRRTSESELSQLESEFDAMREDLQSSIEELETSREELQSLNEELSTVNDQLEDKVQELESTNNDLSNLLSSTEIATIFVDRDFRIRRFTPAAAPLLRVIPSDVGRPIGDLALRVNDPDLIDDARSVLKDLVRIEREVQNHDGRWFLRRAVPYRTAEQQIAGVVITFSEVSSLKETTRRLALRESQQAAVAQFGRFALATRDLDTVFDRATRVVAETLGCELCEVLELLPGGQELLLRAGVGWSEGLVGAATVSAGQASQAGYTMQSSAPVIVSDLSSETRFSGPSLLAEHEVVSGMSVVVGPPGDPWGVLGVHAKRAMEFTLDDVNFLQVVSHILATAIGRESHEERVREANRQLEERYLELETIYQEAPVGLAVVDADLRFVRVNATMAAIDGVSIENSIGQRISHVLPSELARDVEAELRETLATGRSLSEVEISGVTHAEEAGRRHWLASFHPIHRSGEPVGVICVVRDTTESKWVAARVEAEYGVARILANADDFTRVAPEILAAIAKPLDFEVAEYWSIDAQQRIECIARFTSEPEIEQVWERAGPEGGFAIGEGLVGSAWEKAQPVWSNHLETEQLFQRREAAQSSGLAYGAAFPVMLAGEVVGVLALFAREAVDRDANLRRSIERIAEEIGQARRRILAELSMRASETIFRETVEQAPIPIFLFAFDGEILTVNRAFVEATGYDASDVPRKEDWMGKLLRVPSGEVAPKIRELHRRLRSSDEFPEPEEVDIFTRDGRKRRWRLYRCPPMQLTDGRDFGTTMAVDITDRVEAEAALAEARDSAEAASRLKSAFLANVSHEIRTPMTAVLGYADLLRDEAQSDDALRMISIIRRNGQYLIEIIEDILDLSRIEADRLEIANERVEVERVIVDVASLMRARAAEKGLSLAVDFEGEIPASIETDPTRLRQIMINLVGNAVKFTDAGGVRIVTRFDAEASSLRIAVVDTGIGISADLQAKLFEPFFQGAPTKAYSGSGLGLAISRRLASLLGGEISISSVEGQGSTFELALPTGAIAQMRTIEGAIALADDDALEAEGFPALSTRALVVDDHPDVRELVGNLLERCGARVSTAEDGVRALALAEEAQRAGDPFGTVVLDMQLPGMDGYGVAEQLRQSGFAGAIIALTASAMNEDRERGLAAGCDDYLAKPIRKSDLLRLLRRHANGRVERESEEGTRRILIVEDDDDARSALMGLLKRRTSDAVRAAGSGAEALETARQWIPDVVLLDLSLPDMDGLELARTLREERSLAGARLIALTGRTEDGIEEEVRRAGCAAMLCKPVQDVAEIIRTFSAQGE